MVQWIPVSGAESYLATATADDGTQMSCTSQAISCVITGLGCERTYIVNVTPISGSCKNMINTTWATFHTGKTDWHLLQSWVKKKKKECDPLITILLRHCCRPIFQWEWMVFPPVTQLYLVLILNKERSEPWHSVTSKPLEITCWILFHQTLSAWHVQSLYTLETPCSSHHGFKSFSNLKSIEKFVQ